MRLEIEMKARVADRAAVEEALDRTAERVRAFSKADAYYLFPGAEPGQGRTFRIRWDGGKASEAIVTWKERFRSGGLEVNREHEFGVTDAEGMAALCLRLGATPYFSKLKRGIEYRCAGLTVELVEVPPLGTFLEVEKIVEAFDQRSEDEEAHFARQEILRLLALCGLSESDVEERYYSQMLREAGAMAWDPQPGGGDA